MFSMFACWFRPELINHRTVFFSHNNRAPAEFINPKTIQQPAELINPETIQQPANRLVSDSDTIYDKYVRQDDWR